MLQPSGGVEGVANHLRGLVEQVLESGFCAEASARQNTLIPCIK